VAAICLLGSAIFMLAVGWYSPIAVVLPVVMTVGSTVGAGIARGLRLPPSELPPLGRVD
jgi:hypothetical protein